MVGEVLLSMCSFYWLRNKELAWPIASEEEGRVKRCHGAATRDRCAKTLLVGHDLVVIYR